MGARLKELLQELNMSDSNETVTCYLTKYITKESKKQTELCVTVNTGNETVNEFIKEEFLLSNSVYEEKPSENPSSSSGCLKTRTKKQSESEISDPLSTFIDKREPNITKMWVLYGLENSYTLFKNIQDSESGCILRIIRYDLKFLIEHEGVSRPPLPTHRPYRFTDIVYLKYMELESIFSQFLALSNNLENVGCDATFNLVEKDPKLIIVSLYMLKLTSLLTESSIQTEALKAELISQITTGFTLFMKYVKSYKYDYIKIGQYVWDLMHRIQHFDIDHNLIEDSNAEFLEIVQEDLKNITDLVDNMCLDTLRFMLKEFVEYQSLLEGQGHSIYKITMVSMHPIFRLISLAFFYMQEILVY